jgi:hypothetical protein
LGKNWFNGCVKDWIIANYLSEQDIEEILKLKLSFMSQNSDNKENISKKILYCNLVFELTTYIENKDNYFIKSLQYLMKGLIEEVDASDGIKMKSTQELIEAGIYPLLTELSNEDLRKAQEILKLNIEETKDEEPAVEVNKTMEIIPKIFISYSWDGEAHKKWVLTMAEKLTENGVHVFLDRYDLNAGKDMTSFMENSVQESDKVLLIMTPNFKIKAEKREGGVGYETSMITAEIFKNQQTEKFIPIVRLGDRDSCTPTFVQSRLYIDMSDDTKFEENFEELLRSIHNEPKIKRPPIGKKPDFSKK